MRIQFARLLVLIHLSEYPNELCSASLWIWRPSLQGTLSSFWAWSINHPLLKLQSVGRFQLRMRLVRDTVGGLMWGLYFCSQPQQTGEPQTSTSLINNECQGERRWTVDPRVSLSSQSNLPGSLPLSAARKLAQLKGKFIQQAKTHDSPTKHQPHH